MDTNKILVPVIAAGAGAAVGFVAGYYVSQRRNPIEVIHVDISKKEHKDVEEVEEAPKNPIVVEKLVIDADEFESQIKAQKDLKQEIEEIREKDREILSRPTNNVFTMDVDEVWDYEAELAGRKPDGPYVIHKDEFMENEFEYSQETLTFYEGDEIMADQTDAPLWGWFDMMGTLKFGHGSEDPNVVYIRNDALHFEWEILRHTGRFEVEVGGMTIEEEYSKQDLKHSNTPRKFREY